MPYDRALADRIRVRLAGRDDVGAARLSERAMFGGLAFLVDGRMALAAGSGGALMLRVPVADAERVRARSHVGPMVMRGRELAGWVLVEPGGCRTARQLDAWIGLGLTAAQQA